MILPAWGRADNTPRTSVVLIRSFEKDYSSSPVHTVAESLARNRTPWCTGNVGAAAALHNKASVSAGNPGAPAWDHLRVSRGREPGGYEDTACAVSAAAGSSQRRFSPREMLTRCKLRKPATRAAAV